MRAVAWRALALAVLATAPAMVSLASASDASAGEDPPLVRTGERVFALTMESNRFNARTWPDTPLLEAYEGERMRFLIHVPVTTEMHTFHLHGHPWIDPDTGDWIDAVRLDAGETHRFNQTAGLGAGHDGDWFYHCHVSDHFEAGMWGLLRVYPYSVSVEGSLDALSVTLVHEGDGLEGATLSATLRDNVPDTPSPSDATAGEPVDLTVRELGDGRYRVAPDLPAGATGELILQADHPEQGASLARLDLAGDGSYELDRDVIPEGSRAPDPGLPGRYVGARLPG